MRFAIWLQQICGISLRSDRKYLACSKLNHLLNRYGDFNQLTEELIIKPHSQLVHEVIEAMTTNETMWFRDVYPFHALKDIILPRVKTNLRMWSAASSSGQEAYSMAISITEYQRQSGNYFNCQILATDITRKVLNQAKSGIYSSLEIQRGLETSYLSRYFAQINGQFWQINPTIRNMVQFRHLNLMDNFVGLGLFDVIFCRNLLIYLNDERKNSLLHKLYLSLKPCGYLILGASESLNHQQLTNQFKLIEYKSNVIYQAI